MRNQNIGIARTQLELANMLFEEIFYLTAEASFYVLRDEVQVHQVKQQHQHIK